MNACKYVDINFSRSKLHLALSPFIFLTIETEHVFIAMDAAL